MSSELACPRELKKRAPSHPQIWLINDPQSDLKKVKGGVCVKKVDYGCKKVRLPAFNVV